MLVEQADKANAELGSRAIQERDVRSAMGFPNDLSD